MKANFFTESVLYWLAKKVSAAAQKLPPEWNIRVGGAMGWLLYYALPGRRVAALDNLRAAFGRLHTPPEYQDMVKDLFMHMGRMFMEVAAIPAINREYVDQWIMVSPGARDKLDKELAKGKGVIFLAGHFGNWELVPIMGALHGYPTTVLAREQGWPRINRMLTEYRESKGSRVVNKGFPVREVIQSLKDGRIVGIVADQDGGKNGVFSPFFGRLASTAAGTIALSIRTGASILPVFMVRVEGARHSLMIEDPLKIPEKGTEEERLQAGVDGFLQVLEKYVRRYPTQWLWLHRRWKSSPERKFLILSDGKAGHLSQSRALAQKLEEAWALRTAEDERLKGKGKLAETWIAKVVFRHPSLRPVLDVVASVPPLQWIGRNLWLRIALTPESYQQICSEHAHVSISCGSGTAAVNLLWARQIRCKPVHILKSTFPPWRKFDLAVIPRHDLRSGKELRNLIQVDGAMVPTRKVTPEQAKEWSQLLKLTPKRRKIGLLLGGPAKKIGMDEAEAEKIAAGLLQAAEKLNAELLVSTSRRTTSRFETRLYEMLSRNPRCRLLTLVNQRRAGGLPNTDTAVPCILELCDLLVVSGDSISMVSEAAATGKPVLSFPPQAVTKKKNGRNPDTKHHRFLRQMEGLGRLKVVAADRIVQSAIESADGARPRAAAPVPGEDPMVERLRGWF